MATIINPITTVLLNRKEFESGEFDRFPFKYILEEAGTITYFSKLSAERFVMSHEASIKGLATNRTAETPEAIIQPLPGGIKVPGVMFEQIKQFFLDVMDIGPSSYEAQAFIVWSTKEKSYRIIIPKQKVSAAAVRYDIGDMLGEGDVIIVDIHSHNTMGAFFSGTDNKDDKKNPWISGVFGKITTNMEYKFRFNDGAGRHFEMEAEEVFDFGTGITTPREWLDQVEISTYTPVKQGGVRTWEERLDRPSGKDGWTSFENGSLDFDIPSDDSMLYDALTDELLDLTHEDAIMVLNALQRFANNPEVAPDLDEHQKDSYDDCLFHIVKERNHKTIDTAISQLLAAYGG